MHLLFVYGTLLDPVVQNSVFGRIIEGKSDNLAGYKVNQKFFKSGIYPAVEYDGISVTIGKVLRINKNELHYADLYEGEEYKRVEVVLESGVKAWIYVPTWVGNTGSF